MKICKAILAATLLGSVSMALAQDVNSDVKKTAKDTGSDTKKAADKTGHATKVAAKDTAKGTEKVAKKTGSGVKKGTEATGHELKKAGDDMKWVSCFRVVLSIHHRDTEERREWRACIFLLFWRSLWFCFSGC